MNAVRIVFAILAAGPIWAQSTVVVSGKITDVATGLPVEGAAITLRMDGPDGARRMVFADAGGNYSFDEVAPGTGKVEIDGDGFLAFQKTNPDDVSIRIAAGHAEHNFKLTPAASIIGRIIGTIGGEGPGGLDKSVVLTLLREDFTDGVRHFVAGGEKEGAPYVGVSAIGPDGSFRVSGLEPGRYIISAGPRGGISYFISRNGTTGEVPVEHPAEGYVQTFYPGTADFSAAIPVSLSAGEARTADFKVAKRPLFRASGEVSSPGGERWEGTLQVVPTGDGAARHVYTGTASVPGPFVVEGLPPGQYAATVIISAGQAMPTNATGSSVSFSMRTMRVNLAFAITDHNLEGLRISPAFQGQFGASGLFRMSNSGIPLPAGLSVQYAYPEPGGESTPIPAAPGGEFWLNGAPGDYSVQPVVPPGYAAREIRYGGTNFLNSLIPMNGNSLDSSLIIVLTNQPGAVAGSIVDGEQKPVPARIVLVPDPLPANFDFRAIRAVNNDTQGAFKIGGIAPGRYKAVALTGDERKQDHDLTLLGPKLGIADSFEVTSGQSVNINVHP